VQIKYEQTGCSKKISKMIPTTVFRYNEEFYMLSLFIDNLPGVWAINLYTARLVEFTEEQEGELFSAIVTVLPICEDKK